MANLVLEHLSTEILDSITSYLQLDELSSFIRSSNTLLYKKLVKQGGTRSITTRENWNSFEQLSPCNPRLTSPYSPRRLLRWSPRNPCPFKHMTSLVWAQNSKTPFLHFLPPTLTNLDVQSSDIGSLVLSYFTGDPIKTNPDLEAQSYSLETMFPELLSLTLTHRQIVTFAVFQEGSGPYSPDSKFLKRLPRSLQKLHVSLFQPSFLFENAALLPSGLISLGLWISIGTSEVLEEANPKDFPELCGILSQLTRLDIPFYKPRDNRVLSLLGSSIEHLSLQSIDVEAILYLPQTLTHLTLLSPVSADHSSSKISPQVYLSMIHPTLKWPSKLRVYKQISFQTPLAFPRSIDTLELCARDISSMSLSDLLSVVLNLDALVVLYAPSLILLDFVLLDLPKTLLELHIFSIKQTGFLVLPGDIPKVWSPAAAALCASRFIATLPLRIFCETTSRFQCNTVVNIPDGVERLEGVSVLHSEKTRLPPSLTVANADMKLSQMPVQKYPPHLIEIQGNLKLKLSELSLLPKTLKAVQSMQVEVNQDMSWRYILKSDLESLVYKDDIARLTQQYFLPNITIEKFEFLGGWYHGPYYLPPNLKVLVVKKHACFRTPKANALPSILTHLEIDEELTFWDSRLDLSTLPHLTFLKLGGSAGKEFLYFGRSDFELNQLQTLEIYGCKALRNRPLPLAKMLPFLTSLRLLGRLLLVDADLESLLPNTLTHAQLDAPLLTSGAAQWIPQSLSSLILPYDASISAEELLSLRNSSHDNHQPEPNTFSI